MRWDRTARVRGEIRDDTHEGFPAPGVPPVHRSHFTRTSPWLPACAPENKFTFDKNPTVPAIDPGNNIRCATTNSRGVVTFRVNRDAEYKVTIDASNKFNAFESESFSSNDTGVGIPFR